MTTMTLPRETRVLDVQIRDMDTKDGYTRLAGRALPYGVETDIGWYKESFAAGSLAKSIAEAARDLPLLLFHDGRTFPIGAADEWQDSRTALDGIWRLDHGAEAQRAAQLADDGLLTGMSIGFAPVRSEWTYLPDNEWNPDLGQKDRVTRLEARLLEVSVVSTPAYKDAAVKWVRTGEQPIKRAMQAREVDAWRAELERLRSGA
jgi:hypothetical protein